MGAIARESSRGWMGFSILWGLNIAYSLSTLYYQTVSFSQHPRYSLVCILAVVLFNVMFLACCAGRAAGSTSPAGNA
jgi:ferrous iron transport protein B